MVAYIRCEPPPFRRSVWKLGISYFPWGYYQFLSPVERSISTQYGWFWGQILLFSVCCYEPRHATTKLCSIRGFQCLHGDDGSHGLTCAMTVKCLCAYEAVNDGQIFFFCYQMLDSDNMYCEQSMWAERSGAGRFAAPSLKPFLLHPAPRSGHFSKAARCSAPTNFLAAPLRWRNYRCKISWNFVVVKVSMNNFTKI